MAQSERKDNQQIASTREMGESIWVAIVLAFVLRAFVLEAFVIPTGSMAPRLMASTGSSTARPASTTTPTGRRAGR